LKVVLIAAGLLAEGLMSTSV